AGTAREPDRADGSPLHGRRGAAICRWLARGLVGRLQSGLPGPRALVLPHGGQLADLAGGQWPAPARTQRAPRSEDEQARLPPADRCGRALSPHLPPITSVDLMMATTSSPTASLMDSTECLVIADTISCPPTSMMISAITAPSVTLLILPFSWFRALICIGP